MERQLCPICGAYWRCDCKIEPVVLPAQSVCDHDWIDAIGVELDPDVGSQLEGKRVCSARLCGSTPCSRLLDSYRLPRPSSTSRPAATPFARLNSANVCVYESRCAPQRQGLRYSPFAVPALAAVAVSVNDHARSMRRPRLRQLVHQVYPHPF